MFHYGIVENNLDPQELGRVQVRVFDLHTPDQVMIPTEDLPWAAVALPTTSASTSGVGITPSLQRGSMVMLTFADPDTLQYPVVTGSIQGMNEEYIQRVNGVEIKRGAKGKGFQDNTGVYPKASYRGDVDTNKLARFDTFTSHDMYKTRTSLQKDTDGNDIQYQCANPPRVSSVAADRDDSYYQDVYWSEPPIADGLTPEYPYNQVRESRSGIVEEWDDTPGQTRVHQYHPSGTYEEIIDDGSKTIKVVGKDYEMYLDGKNVYINGNLNLTVTGDKRELIQGNYHLEVEGDMTMEVKESLHQKIDKDHAVEVQFNRTTNIGENEVLLVSGDKTETTVGDEVRIVNGKYASQVVGDANYTFQSNRKTKTSLNDEEVITGTKKKMVGQEEQIAVKGNRTKTIVGNETSAVTLDRTEIVTGTDTETVGKTKTTSVTGNYTRNSDASIRDNANEIHHN